jgi:hypothetical protein
MSAKKLREGLIDLFFGASGGISDMAEKEVAQAMDLFEQEYLRRVEVAKPTREDESPVDVVTGRRVETYGYEVTHNSAIDQYEHNLKQLSEGEK